MVTAELFVREGYIRERLGARHMCTVSLRKGVKLAVKSTRYGLCELAVISFRVTSGYSRNITNIRT